MKYESSDEGDQDEEDDGYCGREVEPRNKNKIKKKTAGKNINELTKYMKKKI